MSRSVDGRHLPPERLDSWPKLSRECLTVSNVPVLSLLMLILYHSTSHISVCYYKGDRRHLVARHGNRTHRFSETTKSETVPRVVVVRTLPAWREMPGLAGSSLCSDDDDDGVFVMKVTGQR